MYQRILVAVDGSDSSNRALSEAVNLAKAHHAILRIIHVIDEGDLYSGLVIDPTSTVNSWGEEGREILDKSYQLALTSEVKAETRLVENENGERPIANVILNDARSWQADLLVSGTHGRKGLKHLLMGSVAEGMVRNSPIPILLIRSPSR